MSMPCQCRSVCVCVLIKLSKLIVTAIDLRLIGLMSGRLLYSSSKAACRGTLWPTIIILKDQLDYFLSNQNVLTIDYLHSLFSSEQIRVFVLRKFFEPVHYKSQIILSCQPKPQKITINLVIK